MADYSDAINWQRSTKPWVALNDPKQAELKRIYEALLKQQQQQKTQPNQQRQGINGVNSVRGGSGSDQAAVSRDQAATDANGGRAQQIDRSAFTDELKDPAVRQRLSSLAYRETGGQGTQAQQAFIESVVNRAAARGKTIAETISGRDGYYPATSLQPVSATRTSSYGPIIDTVAAGSNLSNGATGNASGTVGFNGGTQTYSANGERFGREGPDRNWKIPYRQSADDAFNQPYRTVNDTDGAGWRDAPPMTGQFTTYQRSSDPSAPTPGAQTSSWSQRGNAFSPQWNADGTITWDDGTRQQASALW